MSTKKTSARKRPAPKATPADQLTKAKAPTELEAAENGVKKEKTTTISDFRRALAIGRENVDKYAKNGGKAEITIKMLGNDGVESTFTEEYTIKLLKTGDYLKYHLLQTGMKAGKEITVMSSYAAAVIVGCVDEKGDRIFSPKDAELLDCHANASEVMGAAGEILTASGVTGDQDAVEKPN